MVEPSYLAAVRDSYDTVAVAYNEIVKFPSNLDPLGHGMLAAFTELVTGNGPVADLGCGPGKITAHLAAKGLPIFGVDLSPNMIEEARKTYPGLDFRVGSMTSLDLPDGELGGILAYYSTFHTPPEHLPLIFSEFHRTLAPGGHLLLGVHIGDNEHRRPVEAYGGHPVSYESFLLPPERLAELLRKAGLTVIGTLTQGPNEANRRSANFMARK